MNRERRWLERIGLIATLVDRAPGQVLGRTAIMKLCYFLQALRNIPLGYDFTLHTYGPFQSDVLEDLAYAQVFGAVTEKTVSQAEGYRYEVRPGKRCAKAQQVVTEWLEQHRKDLDWVIGEFARFNASDLELFSTIVFVDRENAKEGRRIPLDQLEKQVRNIKPRFPESYVLEKCRQALEKKFLKSVSPA
jgi:hypothetical protein